MLKKIEDTSNTDSNASSASLPSREAAFVTRLKYLHNLLTDRFDSYESHSLSYLRAGLEMFAADTALLLRLRFLQDTAITEYSYGEETQQFTDVSQTAEWCAKPIEQKMPVLWNSSCVDSSFVTYNGINIHGYLCSPVVVSGQSYGLLCFLKTGAELDPFTDVDFETITFMAKGVAKVIELQRVQPIDQESLRANFATSGVKTFEEFVRSARLPEVYGVPGRVVEVLQKRIGKVSLSIDLVAGEMNLSKRTLQRRLQQQGISFAHLRDQVRFHYSINYLVENSLSIDSISSSLDFSDRTSFTNAFKRWTGLSPSTFRKLFRDYA